MKRLLILMVLALSLCFSGYAQHVVSGRVVGGRDSTHVQGASVRFSPMVGASQTVVTGIDGAFRVSLPDGVYRVRVSCVGYSDFETQFKVPYWGSLIVALMVADNQLEDLTVSTGYQVLDRTRSTGSFSKIGEKELSQQVGRNVLDRLEAIGNGLSVDRATSSNGRIMIRGLSTIRGPKEPLIILDDFAYAGDLGNINPDDVESITVLKDAAAASIWGARAGNGVIVITTKRAKFNAPLSIDFNSAVSLVGKPDLRYEQRMSSADFLGVEDLLYSKGYYNSQLNSVQKPPLTPYVELLLLNSAGQLSASQLAEARAGFSGHDVYDDFRRYVYQPGLNQQYSLRLSGGGEQNVWSVSSGFNQNRDNLGLVDERSTLRFSNTFKLLKNLQLSSILTYAGAKVRLGRQGVGEILSYSGLYPYASFADASGVPLPITKQYRQTYLSSPAVARLLDWSYYPLLDYAYTNNTNTLRDLNANFDLSYRLPMGLKASVKYSIEEQRNSQVVLQGVESFYTRNYINSFTQVPATGSLVYPVPVGAIRDSNEGLLNSRQFRAQLDYNKAWKDHQVSALIGFESRRGLTEGASSRVYGLDTDKLNTGQVDYTRTYPNFVNGSNSFIQSGDSFNLRRNNFVSQFANLSYTFKDTYTFSASARADASNVFGISTNNRWKPLSSFGLAWEVTRMPFFKVAMLDFLKIRTTYGLSGNVDPSMVGVNTIRFQATSAFTQLPYAVFDKFSNPDLRWETVRMLNLGLDFGLWKGRLSGSVEYYSKRADDLFGFYPIDYTAGIGSTVIKNVAEIKGSGVDLQLNSKNVSGRFTWGSTLNFSMNRDRVLTYYLATTDANTFVQSSANVSGIEGLPVYSVFSYKWAGLDHLTGDPLGVVNGAPSRDYNLITGPGTGYQDLRFHGSALPRYFGNLVNNFSFGGLTISVALGFKFDYYFRRRSIEYNTLFSTWEGHADFQKRWQSPGDELVTNVPSISYPNSIGREAFYKFSEVLVERGDHVRLQYVNLDYALKSKVLSKFKVRSLNFFANVSNLGIIYRANKSGLDPEFVSNSFNLPPGRLFSFGVRISL